MKKLFIRCSFNLNLTVYMQKIVRKNQNVPSTKNKQNINSSDIKTPSPSKRMLMSRLTVKQPSQVKIQKQAQMLQTKMISQEQNFMALMFQYKLVQSYGPLLGIYCTPNSQDYYIWNCMIFVREGYYKQAKFKFDLFINNQNIDFPPKVIFTSSTFHPLIDQNTGQLDVNELLLHKNKKLQQKNTIYQLLRSIKQMFSCQQNLSNRRSFNPLAAKTYLQKNSFFISKVFQTVLKSKERLYQNSDSGSFADILMNQTENNEPLSKLKQQLKQICLRQMPVQQKQKQFSKFVQSTFSQMLGLKIKVQKIQIQEQVNQSLNDEDEDQYEADPSQISFEFDQQYMANVHNAIINE